MTRTLRVKHVNSHKPNWKKIYDEKFKFNDFKSIIKYGMAFFRKKCLIEMKVNDENIKEYEDNEDDNKI